MNATVLARKLNERRFRASPILTTGEIISMVGSDGLQEALNRRWVTPDQDTGFLTVNTNGGKLAELAEACKCKQCSKTDCKCEESSEEPPKNGIANALREAWAGMGVGAGSNGGGNPPIMPRQAPMASPTSPANPNANAPQIGDDVMVADEGQSFTGKVGSVGQDGRYRLNFAGTKPRMNREYSSNELRKVGGTTPNA